MSREIAVWVQPDESPRRGVVVKRGSAKAAVLVEWDGGRQEKVQPGDPTVKFAPEGSQRLEWLLKPGLLETQFKADPAGVFVSVIRDEGKPIQSLQVRKRLEALGLPATKVQAEFEKAKAALQENHHVVIEGAKHVWSDVAVDPYAALRMLSPFDAFDRLQKTAGLKPPQRTALGDAIRVMPPHDALDRLLETPRLKPEGKTALEQAVRGSLPPRAG